MMIVWQTGLNQYYIDSNLAKTDVCSVSNRPQSVNKPLTLIDLSSAFLFLVMGIGLSIIAFIVEMSMPVLLSLFKVRKYSSPRTNDQPADL